MVVGLVILIGLATSFSITVNVQTTTGLRYFGISSLGSKNLYWSPFTLSNIVVLLTSLI
jgi:hypothetical protein